MCDNPHKPILLITGTIQNALALEVKGGKTNGPDADRAWYRWKSRERLSSAGLKVLDTRQQHVVAEAADLIYHLFVLLAHCDISLAQIDAELRGRFGVSGLDEKAARGQNGASDE